MAVEQKVMDDLNVTPYRPLDPRQIYDDSAALNAQSSHGLERLVYKLFGPNFVSSLAFAINPLARFVKLPVIQTSQLRKRFKKSIPIRRYRLLIARDRTRSNFLLNGSYPALLDSWSSLTNSSGTVAGSVSTLLSADFTPQSFIEEYSVDTISSQRPKGVVGGPFEKFEKTFSYKSPTALVSKYSINTYPSGQSSDSSSLYTRRFVGPLGRLTLDSQTLLLNNEKTRANSVLNSTWPAMLTKCLPTTPRFELLRALAELKDFRHGGSLTQRVTSMRDLLSDLRHQPDLYLSLQFGLKPLVSDIKSLLATPARVAKQLNMLLERSGLPTAYRTKILLDPPSYSHPSFDWSEGIPDLSYVSSSTSLKYDSEVRMAINATFQFPPAELPSLRESLVDKLYGENPTIDTLYNLTPWSWLLDWFTGFGEYVNIIERINTDPSLINYGYITYASKGILRGDATLSWIDSDTRFYRPDVSHTYTTKRTVGASSQYEFSFQKRVNMSDLGVASTLVEPSLNSFQSSILGALLAQRIR